MSREQKHFVAIAGNIGAGKTTLAERLARQLGWKCHLEPVIQNPYLSDFYADMSRWAFHLQIYFLSKRFQSQLEIDKDPVSCVQDRTIYEDAEIFARTLHKRGAMSDRELENYFDLFDSLIAHLRPPDLVVYLKCGVEQLLERISKRGRNYETGIDPEYLEDLNNAYDQWAESYSGKLLIVTIDTMAEGRAFEHEVFEECMRLLRMNLQLEIDF
ncbi:MAG: deoxynucleoside kinase [Calditrichaeota bacterium]|nr:deoxynucleoside kinase [Calditrichota bacterium]MCB9366452.1 deoxynucleoside kinase [Calditrichota bacterium]MCB9391290.1 deoxynucleoside kinase [Calditrichota bacterium]